MKMNTAYANAQNQR